jgi:hypothetical protein
MNAKTPSQKAILALTIFILIGCATILVYALQTSSFAKFVSVFGIGLFIAGASVITGSLLGFLFGIPKTLQQEKPDRPTTDGSNKQEDAAENNGVSYQANTNLEQISDWLTKILVGVGLTQLNSLPSALRSFGAFVSPGLGNKPESSILGIVILFFFFVCGFLVSYLWTRLYFGNELKKADMEIANEQKIAENKIKIAEVESKVNEREKQEKIDEKAIMLVQRQLNPASDTDQVPQKELDEAIKAASSKIKVQIYYLAQNNRSENWKDPAAKIIMERSIPIFRALIASDPDDNYHLNHGQLGFALKDQRQPNFKEAESELTKAIEIRGSWKEEGWLFYEFNRALCRIHNDESFLKDMASKPEIKKIINEDLKTAENASSLGELISKDPTIQKWRSLNKAK